MMLTVLVLAGILIYLVTGPAKGLENIRTLLGVTGGALVLVGAYNLALVKGVFNSLWMVPLGVCGFGPIVPAITIVCGIGMIVIASTNRGNRHPSENDFARQGHDTNE
ncbi:MAG: hypothetical protein ACM3UZ_16830 [Acidobacteriota bacterium]